MNANEIKRQHRIMSAHRMIRACGEQLYTRSSRGVAESSNRAISNAISTLRIRDISRGNHALELEKMLAAHDMRGMKKEMKRFAPTIDTMAAGIIECLTITRFLIRGEEPHGERTAATWERDISAHVIRSDDMLYFSIHSVDQITPERSLLQFVYEQKDFHDWWLATIDMKTMKWALDVPAEAMEMLTALERAILL